MSEEQLRALATEKWFMDEGVLHVEQLAKAGISKLRTEFPHAGDLLLIFPWQTARWNDHFYWVSMAATCFCNLIHIK